MFFRVCVGVALVVAGGASALAGSPDQFVWDPSCKAEFLTAMGEDSHETSGEMPASLVQLLETGTLPEGASIMTRSPTGEMVPMSVDELKAMLEDDAAFADAASSGGYSLPWLTIYNGAGHGVLHRKGYDVSRSVDGEDMSAGEEWRERLDGGVVLPIGQAPSLDTVASYLGVDGAAFLDGVANVDAVFVQYGADWCAPCKVQLAEIEEFASEATDYRIEIVQIDADFNDQDQACSVSPSTE